jgi:hypothetical protein
VLQQHAANDQEEVHAAYSLVRTFVWALPVLGLIGTVIGISLAVGGFAEFLGSGVDDVSLIKKNLVGVTGGLSFAFLITLQGLLTSLLLMLVASVLQTREQRLNTEVQQGIADHFMPTLQRVAPAAERREPDPAAVSHEAMAKIARGVLETVQQNGQEQLAAMRKSIVDASQIVLDAVRDAADQWLRDLQGRNAAAQANLAEWSESHRAQLVALTDRIGGAIEQSGTAMASTAQWLEGRLVDVRRTLEEHANRLRDVLECQARAFAQPHADLMAAIGEQNKLVRANAEALGAVSQTNAAVLETQKALQTALREFQGGDFDRVLRDAAGALSAQCRDIQGLTRAVQGLTELTGQVIASQAVLQTATKDLREGSFGETLAAFHGSLASVADVLDGFRKPFVLQAVALPSGENGRTAN